MKKALFLFFLLLQYMSSFADPGDAWRYKVKIQLKNFDSLTGYVYFYTYTSGFDSSKTEFTEFAKTHLHFPLALYSEIKTLQIKEDFEVDFFISNNKHEIKKTEIVDIELLEELKFLVGSRFHEVTTEQYKLLDQNPLELDFIHEDWMENCTLVFLSWSNSEKLSKTTAEIKGEMNRLLSNGEENTIYTYLENLSPDLSKSKVLMFNHCHAL